MYQKQYFVYKIKDYYPAGLFSDAEVATDSKQKAVQHILQKLMIVQLVNDFGSEYGLRVADLYASYRLVDLHKGKECTFYYDDNPNLSNYLRKLIERHTEDKELKNVCHMILQDCSEQLKEESSWKELFVEQYIDLTLNISVSEEDIEDFLKEHNTTRHVRSF